MVMVYVGWRLFKYAGETYTNFLWGGWDWFKNVLGNSLTHFSATVLRLAGYELVHYKRVIIIEGTRGIYVADLCLGIAPMVIFSGFILSYGDNKRDKLWFIPLGIFAIYIINVLRICALALVQYHYNKLFRFAHEYLYVTVTYGFIFLMVIWWMNKWADKKSAQETQ
jgi:exosortase/archaeosortase family protein